MVKAAIASLFIWAIAAAASAQSCRQALALGLDVSGSVDAAEYRLQLDGLAAALEDPLVADVLLAAPEVPVMLAVYEWSGSRYQRMIQDWIAVDSAARLAAIADGLRSWQRGAAPETTGLGAALEFGAALLARGPDCDRATLDISGDGKNNVWPRPVLVHGSGVLSDITVNALVIAIERMTQPDVGEAGDVADLTAYFHERIIHGPGAFIEVALGFEDYAQAMKRKLLRELATVVMGSLQTEPDLTTN